jgi:hypothetical protein
VLPHLGQRRVQQLLAELRREGGVHPRGQRRWARWHPGSDPSMTRDRHAAPASAEDPPL